MQVKSIAEFSNWSLMQVKSIAECSNGSVLTFIKLPFVVKTFVLSIFEWPLKTCSTVVYIETKQL